jgi:hypothetical protein
MPDSGELLNERGWLIELAERGGARVGDTGYDFTEDAAEFAYERDGRRFEVQIRVDASGT